MPIVSYPEEGIVLRGVRNIGYGLGSGRVSGAAFTGAYDAIPNIVAAYGLRRLRSAYSGNILRIRRSSDNTEQDIGYESDGDLDTAAIATFIGGGSGYIRTWYDQSGNAYDVSQTTTGNQPLYVASGQNGRPVVGFDGVDDRLTSSSNLNLIQPTTIYAVAKETTNNAFPSIIDGDSATARNFLYYRLGQYRIYAGTESQDYGIKGSVHLHLGIFNGASSIIGRDGINDTANIGSYNLSGKIYIGNDYLTTSPLTGNIAELIICNAALSDANRQAAETAANAYWSIY